MKFDWNDISIIPAEISNINSRSQCNPFYEDGTLPLIAAPMDTVINTYNYKEFHKQGYSVCIPRGFRTSNLPKNVFTSYGLNEILDYIEKEKYPGDYVLIDIANGHMRKLFKTAEFLKRKWPNVVLMVGNVANPRTYQLWVEEGTADYVRLGIGGGSGCTTSANGGVHFPMASLIAECSDIKNSNVKIIADGGFKTYSDIIKALAVGADYVMLGGILNRCVESASPCFVKTPNGYNAIPAEEAIVDFKRGIDIYKYFRGMSTKEVQKEWGKSKLTTSEGITRYNKVEYTLQGWTENFIDYLKTNMSYTGKERLSEYIGGVDWVKISAEAYRRFNK